MTSPKTLLNAWDIRAKKQWGQHFLSEAGVARMIVARSGIAPEDVIVEIGPGLGALTIPISQAAAMVYAVERDPQIVELLKNELLNKKISNVIVLNQDILRVDLREFATDSDRKLVVMGNLPYNISSQIIVMLIRCRRILSRAVIMLQKELARRIAASPGCKDYGRLTVLLNYCSEIETLARVEGKLFFPKAKVDSEVIQIKFKDAPDFPAVDEEFLYRVVKAGFSKRRKTLRNALSGGDLSIDAAIAEQALETAGIDPSRRAETLRVNEFVTLSDALVRIIGNGPSMPSMA